jgi:predicted RNA methylase
LNEFGQQYDWLQRYGSPEEDSELRQVIREFVPLRAYILNLGAGISRMSEDMNADGYCTILNVDVSGTAVRLMTDHYKRRFGKWVYKVEPTCRRLYARRTPVHGNATDTALHQTLTRLGIGNAIDWLMGLGKMAVYLRPC